ncbi:MAG: PdaC/SigV domain-containing protein [Hominenteromicrobium sp.]
MKSMKRMVCLLLSVLLLIGILPVSASADEAEEAEAYRQRVFQRYEDYRSGQNTYAYLVDTSRFAYCAWADEIESCNAVEKAILWATHKLLGKELDTEAYMNYLTRIMALMDKGMTETLAAQANYTAKESGLKQAMDIGAATLSAFLDVGYLEKINKDLKALGAGIDLIKITSETIVDSSAAILATALSESCAQKVAFLEAIRDNTDDKALKKAAESLINTAELELAFHLDNRTFSVLLDSADFTAYWLDDTNLDIAIETMGNRLIKEFEPWVRYILGDNSLTQKLSTAAGAALFGMGKLLVAYGCVKTGFTIGGAVMAPFFADDVELFREMKAMDEIGSALSAVLPDLASTASGGSGDTKYTAIRDLVAVGEGLCYVRLRGEYCAVESIRNKKTAPQNLDEIFGWTTSLLTRCYSALAAIFPDRAQQVIVAVSVEETEDPVFLSSLAKPTVYMPGAEDIAEKINNSEPLSSLYDHMAEQRDLDDSSAHESAGFGFYPWEYTVKLYDTYATAGALSLQFMEISYSGGAHPMSVRYSYNFDLETGERLALSDLYDPKNPNAQEALIGLFTQALRKETNDLLSDPENIIRSSFEGSSALSLWRFTEEGLCITFSPYVIASYGAGYIEPVVSYDELDGILNSDYMPPDRASAETTGYCNLYSQSEVNDAGDFTDFYGEESAFGLTSGYGEVFEVSLGDGVNGYSVYRNDVRFYANYMRGGDLFWLPETDTNTFIVCFETKVTSESSALSQALCFTITGDTFSIEDIVLTD